MTDDIGYQALFQAAKRGVMKEALKIAASDNGLPGNHHFYISFRTRAPGVKMAEHLLSRFPEEMTIVVQHQYWDLEVGDNHFEVVLQFSGVPQHLEIPYAAVTRFLDPSVEFVMEIEPGTARTAETLDIAGEREAIAAEAPVEAAQADDAEAEDQSSLPASDGTVVSLDQFRRK